MNRRQITTTLFAVTAVISITVGSNVATAQTMSTPAARLVVSIAVDGLTTRQLEKYADIYVNGGFSRLLSRGAVYRNASHTFAPVDRVAALAAIVTGTTPYYNGISGERQFDRVTLRPISSITDSPESILSSTVTDELKVSTGGKAIVYAVAEDKTAALILGGHAADAALWIDAKGGWSLARYSTVTDNRWISAYNRVNSTDALPYNYSRITDIAAQCVASAGMGIDNTPDILSVTYTVTDSEEAYSNLDRALADLISRVETTVGEGRVLFIVTGTGCDDEAVADYQTYNIPTGTFYINRAQNLLNMFLSATYGQGRYVEACFDNQLFINTKLVEQRKISDDELMKRAKDFLLDLSGVRNVYTANDIKANNCPDERVCNAFSPNAGGDLIIEIAPGWTLLNEDTGEQRMQRASTVPFPIIIMGEGIEAQRTNEHVTVDRIAPTIADCIHIRAPNACRASSMWIK